MRMGKINLLHLAGATGIVATFMLLQGCSTMYRGSEAEDMRLRPMPTALEPQPTMVMPQVVEESGAQARTTFEATHAAVEADVRSATQAATQSAADLATRYRVKAGDNLSSVAYRYGLRWQDVAAVNPGLNPDKLTVGQVIMLPGKVDVAAPIRQTAPTVRKAAATAAAGNLYTVKAGDSLSVIAYRHGIKTAALKEANKLTGDKIIVGQKLVIPGGATIQAERKAPVASRPPVKSPPPPKPIVTRPKPQPIVKPIEQEVKKIEEAVEKVVEPPVVEPPVIEPPVVEPPVVKPIDIAPPVIDDADIAPPPAPVLPGVEKVKYESHTVLEGEDIYNVGIKWSVNTQDIRDANDLGKEEDVTPGMVLKIPVAD